MALEPIAPGSEVRVDYENGRSKGYWDQLGMTPAEGAWRQLHKASPPPSAKPPLMADGLVLSVEPPTRPPLQLSPSTAETAWRLRGPREALGLITPQSGREAPLPWEGASGGDECLRLLVPQLLHTPSNWVLIASHLPGRTAKECKERWMRLTAASAGTGTGADAGARVGAVSAPGSWGKGAKKPSVSRVPTAADAAAVTSQVTRWLRELISLIDREAKQAEREAKQAQKKALQEERNEAQISGWLSALIVKVQKSVEAEKLTNKLVDDSQRRVQTAGTWVHLRASDAEHLRASAQRHAQAGSSVWAGDASFGYAAQQRQQEAQRLLGQVQTAVGVVDHQGLEALMGDRLACQRAAAHLWPTPMPQWMTPPPQVQSPHHQQMRLPLPTPSASRQVLPPPSVAAAVAAAQAAASAAAASAAASPSAQPTPQQGRSTRPQDAAQNWSIAPDALAAFCATGELAARAAAYAAAQAGVARANAPPPLATPPPPPSQEAARPRLRLSFACAQPVCRFQMECYLPVPDVIPPSPPKPHLNCTCHKCGSLQHVRFEWPREAAG